MNRLARWLTAGAAAAVLAMVGPGAGIAQAHPTLLFTEPAAQSAVAAPPEAITLLFNEPVTIGEHAIVLLDQAERETALGPASVQREGRFVTARPTRALAPGSYTVRWRVTGTDGDQVEQEFRFAVGVAAPAATAAGVSARPAWGQAGLRWLLFAGLAVAVGGLVARRFTDTARAEQPALPPLRDGVRTGLVVALAAAVGLFTQRLIDVGSLTAAAAGPGGPVLVADIGGLAAALVIAARGHWALLALTVVLAAEGIRSHAATAAGGWGAVLTGVHLAAATVWVGALVHTLRAARAWRRHPDAVRWVLVSYVRLALWTYLVVLATGVISAVVLVGLAELVSSAYGRVLLIKLGVIAAASAAALTARLLHRRPARAARLRRAMSVEAGALAVVLAASAVLVSTPPPREAAAAPAPPPSRGPLLALGTMAGQIGISVTASDGLLVVRLSTPRRGDYYAPEPDQRYGLSVSVADTVLTPTGCGPGCFYTRLIWRDGDNVVTLRAEAAGWAGAATGLIIPWPPRAGAADLAAAVAATRAAGTVTVYETVTSNTTTASAPPSRLDLDTGFFLAQEPYADGTAPIAARISPPGAPVQLALGYPAASLNAALTLDDHGRISTETLTDAKHLITRRLVYTEPD